MRPATEQDLAKAVKSAGGALRIVGGGTRRLGPDAGGDVLETGALAGISLYEPGALTLVAGAGTPLAEIEAALEGDGQRLPFEVPDLRALLQREGASTIGGVVAANASGPRRVQAGACRDSLIGVRLVDGTGMIVKNGGRVMKNVTGYDLVKLFAGSHGTLGILTEVAFKLLPRPDVQVTLVCSGMGPEGAVTAMAMALGSPFEVTGAAFAGGQTRLRLEGMAGSVAYRSGALARVLGAGWDIVAGAESAALWAEIRDVTPLAGQAGAIWRVSAKPSDMPQVVALMEDAVCDWGGGLIWGLVPDEGDAGAARVRGLLARIGGHATLIRAGAQVHAHVPTFQPDAALAPITAGLRAKFDPRGILNPGLMG
jgi:glycolate oxidase FAD binding subunit